MSGAMQKLCKINNRRKKSTYRDTSMYFQEIQLTKFRKTCAEDDDKEKQRACHRVTNVQDGPIVPSVDAGGCSVDQRLEQAAWSLKGREVWYRWMSESCELSEAGRLVRWFYYFMGRTSGKGMRLWQFWPRVTNIYRCSIPVGWSISHTVVSATYHTTSTYTTLQQRCKKDIVIGVRGYSYRCNYILKKNSKRVARELCIMSYNILHIFEMFQSIHNKLYSFLLIIRYRKHRSFRNDGIELQSLCMSILYF